MLLYIHVPFCRSKCAYCSFSSQVLPKGRVGAYMLKKYLAALIGEMRMQTDILDKTQVRSIFFGGGTPSLLPGRAITGILEETRKCFDVSPGAEITLEANPESLLDGDCLAEARKAGINRLSIGMQSFEDPVLGLLGRRHDSWQAENAFSAARAAGFSNINLDLIWALPGREGRPQSQMRWLSTLRRAVDLQPEHISTYCLSLEDGPPLGKLLEQGEISLPGEREQSSMYLAGADYLEGQGYMQYEISNFARMGFACLHNKGYWQGEDYLGIGPAAVSTMGARRRTNPAHLKIWTEMVAKGDSSPWEELDMLTRLKEILMLRLRTSAGLSLGEWRKRSGRPFLTDFAAQVALLQQIGLARTRRG
ncbi:MAG: radical SAM family heme chaperone HemW, partial [Desulfovibrio sp.]|nr:radical SAM family heme chaperone HemW [Desulfovibrio sp.]